MSRHNLMKIDKRIIYLDSVNKTSGTNESPHFDIHPKIDNVVGFEVLNFDMPFNSFYNITSLCNTFNWTDSGSNALTSTIPIKSYSETELANEIESVMNSDTIALDTYTVEYVLQTGFITITENGSNFQLNISTTSNSLYSKIGFETDQTGATTYTGTKVVNINELFYIYLESKRIKDILLDPPRDATCLSNALHRVKINADFKDKLDNTIQFPVFVNCNGDRLTSIDIKMVDRDGNTVDLNGINWSITIQVFYEHKYLNLRHLRG